jgi:uncharacterized RDD family membrane protein YckC
LIAPIGKRFWALILDIIAHSLISSIIGFSFSTILAFLIGIVADTAFTYYFYEKKGATLGKSIMGIKAVDEMTGQDLTGWQGVMRESLGHSLSGIILGIGYIMPFFNEKNKAFHDYLWGTIVIEAQ